MKASDLRSKTPTELQSELISLEKERFNMRMQKGTEQSSQSHLLKKARRNIARIKTILSEKAREGSSV
jgi:large subunit ribosomal protein L29